MWILIVKYRIVLSCHPFDKSLRESRRRQGTAYKTFYVIYLMWYTDKFNLLTTETEKYIFIN